MNNKIIRKASVIFENIKKQKDIYLVIGLFLFTSIFWILMNIFPKRITIPSDEILYYDIARSLFYGHGIEQLGTHRNFQQIAYSILLIPFFAIKNGAVRIFLISSFNCILLSSSIFPLYLISKKYNSRRDMYIVLFLNSIFPYILFSITFMAEILYYPLIIWIFYFWLLNKEKNNYFISIFIGVLIYIAFMCKGVSLVLLISIVIFEFIFPLLRKVFHGEKYKENFSKKSVLNLLLVLSTFIILFFIFRYTLFNGLDSSYKYTFADFLRTFNSFGKFAYLLYGFLYSIIAVSFAVLFLPVFCPLLTLNKLSIKNIKFYLLCFLFLVFLSAIIAFRITVPEEYSKLNPRGMLRYFGPIYILFISSYLSSRIDVGDSWLNSKKIIIVFSVLLLLCGLIYKGADVGLYMDTFSILWYSAIENAVKRLVTNRGLFYFAMCAISLLLCFGLFFIVYKSSKKNNIKKTYLTCIFATSLTSCILGIISTRTNLGSFQYSTTKDEISNVERIDEFLTKKENTNALFLFNTNIFTVESYLNDIHGYVFEREDWFLERFKDKSEFNIKISDFDFYCGYDRLKYGRFSKIDYIILENTIHKETFHFKNIELESVPSGNRWIVYKNLNREYISLSINK